MTTTDLCLTKTTGKARRLRRLMSADNQFCIVALDQRAILTRMLAQLTSVEEKALPFAELLAVKRLLVQTLSAPASAMLFDPNIAVPAALDKLPRDTGLLISLEHHIVDDTPLGRKTTSIPNWSVEKIQQLGADGAKVLIWYHPDADNSVVDHQQRYIRKVGQQCADHELPFVLELLAYQPSGPGRDGAALPDFSSADNLPKVVLSSVEEFSKPEYQVDLLKLESPFPISLMDNLAEREKDSIQQAFDAVGKCCSAAGIPWVLLSAGVTTEQFINVLKHAYAAGAQGFLAGRAIWKAPLNAYPDLALVKRTLADQGASALTQLIDFTQQNAQTYHLNAAVPTKLDVEGDFAQWYPAEH